MSHNPPREYPELFQTEYPVDGERVKFIRDGADKVLTFLLDHCATSFDDQKIMLEVALADTNGRIAIRNSKLPEDQRIAETRERLNQNRGRRSTDPTDAQWEQFYKSL